MNRILTTICFFIACGVLALYPGQMNAQVSGLSYSVSPGGEFVFWKDKSGFEKHSFLVGGQLGFGFDQFVELRGSYYRSLGLNTKYSRLGLNDLGVADSTLSNRKVKLLRYGGELKLNLSHGAFKPFVTLGTGIQQIDPKGLKKQDQIYTQIGLGVKLSVAGRYTLAVQALDTKYHYNTIGLFDRAELPASIDDETFGLEKINNRSIKASLIFYVGGTRPGSMNPTEKNLFNHFSSGFSGASLPFEPTIARVDFHKSLPLEDTWMAGIATGIDLGQLVGVRAFYWRGIEKFSFNAGFEKLHMIGGEGKFKLAIGQGLIPYVTLGGGVLGALEGYTDKNDNEFSETQNWGFATGGVGVDLPFSKSVKLNGYFKTLLTSNSGKPHFADIDRVRASLMYGVSFNFALGKRSETKAAKKQAAKKSKGLFGGLFGGGKGQKTEVETEIVIDAEGKAVEVPVQGGQPSVGGVQGSGSGIHMSPAEFQNIIHAIQGGGMNSGNAIQQMQQQQENDELKKQLEELTESQKSQHEEMMQQMTDNNASLNTRIDSLGSTINDRFETMEEEMDATRERIDEMEVTAPAKTSEEKSDESDEEVEEDDSKEKKEGSNFLSKFKYSGVSPFAGFNIGGTTSFNVGAKAHFDIGDTKFDFEPEIFVGFGSSTSFGLYANATYNFKLFDVEIIDPYVGAGLGLIKIKDSGEDKLRGSVNFLVGADVLQVGNGNLYVEFAGRNAFKYNQLIAGYKLNF